MKLYEVKALISQDSVQTIETNFYSSERDSRMALNNARRIGCTRQVTISSVCIDTNLKTADWIALLESDAPGGLCTITPVDRITDRKVLKSWSRP